MAEVKMRGGNLEIIERSHLTKKDKKIVRIIYTDDFDVKVYEYEIWRIFGGPLVAVEARRLPDRELTPKEIEELK